MSNLHVYYWLLLTSTYTIFSFKYHANEAGYDIGSQLLKPKSAANITAIVFFIGGVISVFFILPWYVVLAGILTAYISSNILVGLFGSAIQWVSLLMFFLSWPFLFIVF